MFNKSYDHSQHNSQTIHINLSPAGQRTDAVTSLVMFGVFAGAIVGIVLGLAHTVTGVVASLATVLVALFATIAAIFPWLACGAVVVALAVIALRSLPEAMAEIEEIRYHRALAASHVKMLEAKNVDSVVLDMRPVRVEIER